MSEKCVYQTMDKIDSSLEKIGNIIEESEKDDPEFYEALKTIVQGKNECQLKYKSYS